MHPMVIAVYRKKNPNRQGGDVMVYHRDVGLLVPEKSLVHGHILWALAEGREQKLRLEMRYCEHLKEIVFREKFVVKKHEFKSWTTIKTAIKSHFNGRKPSEISWNKAKLEMEKEHHAKAKTEKEKRNAASESQSSVRWPSLMEHRAGAPALARQVA